VKSCTEGRKAIIVACRAGLLAPKFFNLLVGIKAAT
jgi:hypothetical protein